VFFLKTTNYVEMEDLREPGVLQDKIQKGYFNLIFLMTHGAAIPKKEGSSFKIPTNTVLIQTGGDGTYGCTTSTSYDTSLFSRFELLELEHTFGKFLGERGNEKDDTLDPLLFNTPGETALDKYVSLKDSDLTSSDGAWGIYMLDYISGNVKEYVELTKQLIEKSKDGKKYRQSELIGLIHDLSSVHGTEIINIIVSINCIVASKELDENEFIEGDEIAGRRTHFSKGASGAERIIFHPRTKYDPKLHTKNANGNAIGLSRNNSTNTPAPVVSYGYFGEGNDGRFHRPGNIGNAAYEKTFYPGSYAVQKAARKVGLGSAAKTITGMFRVGDGKAGSGNNNTNMTRTGTGAGATYTKTRGGRRIRRRQTRRFRR